MTSSLSKRNLVRRKEQSTRAGVSAKFHAELYAARKAKQHPLYKTAGGDYGVVPKGIEHKVELPRHAKHGKFSKVRPIVRISRLQATAIPLHHVQEFASSGNYRFSGLSTSAPKSRYNPKSDGFL